MKRCIFIFSLIGGFVIAPHVCAVTTLAEKDVKSVGNNPQALDALQKKLAFKKNRSSSTVGDDTSGGAKFNHGRLAARAFNRALCQFTTSSSGSSLHNHDELGTQVVKNIFGLLNDMLGTAREKALQEETLNHSKLATHVVIEEWLTKGCEHWNATMPDKNWGLSHVVATQEGGPLLVGYMLQRKRLPFSDRYLLSVLQDASVEGRNLMSARDCVLNKVNDIRQQLVHMPPEERISQCVQLLDSYARS